MYAREVDGQTLTFFVSGMLWNRSLVMGDKPTDSLWSHILGEAMRGRLKGKRLDVVPSEMTTWAAWRRAHPQTTALNLPRSARDFTRDFYARRPSAFVFAWVLAGRAYHCPLTRLQQQRLVQATCGEQPVLVVFDPQSTGARLFSRRVGDRTLDFSLGDGGRLRDRQTGSTWEPETGVASNGELKRKSLKHLPALMSFSRAWRTFHPESKQVP